MRDEDLAQTLAVIDHCYEQEADSDHERILMAAREEVLDHLDRDVGPEMVETAYETLDALGPDSQDARLFVDTESRYVNGCLPSFREWTAKYEVDGDVIEEREYTHDDEIEINPEIDGTRYESRRVERGDGEAVIHLEPDPVRDDVHVTINASDGKSFVNLDAHPGPDDTDPGKIIESLCNEFDWGMRDTDAAIIRDNPDVVFQFIEDNGWLIEN